MSNVEMIVSNGSYLKARHVRRSVVAMPGSLQRVLDPRVTRINIHRDPDMSDRMHIVDTDEVLLVVASVQRPGFRPSLLVVLSSGSLGWISEGWLEDEPWR